MRQPVLAVICVAMIGGGAAYAQELGAVGGGGGFGVSGAIGGMIGPGGSISSHGDNSGTTFTYNFPRGATVFAVTGAPYSGRMSTQSVWTLVNGTHLVQQPFDQPTTYRDTMGRTRTDMTMQRIPSGMNAPNMQPQVQRLAEITDPVAGYRYVLDQGHQIAYRIAVQTRQSQAPSGAFAAARTAAPITRPMVNPKGATMTDEDLGTQTILGIPATGHRNTTTYPVGTYQGNDAPVTSVNENWHRVQYGLTMLSKTIGPENESTTTMKDFSREEPDPALFQIPAGYQIVDESGEFTITIPRNAR